MRTGGWESVSGLKERRERERGKGRRERGKRERKQREREHKKKKAAGGWEHGCLRGGHSIRKFYLLILVSYLSLSLFGKTH